MLFKVNFVLKRHLIYGRNKNLFYFLLKIKKNDFIFSIKILRILVKMSKANTKEILAEIKNFLDSNDKITKKDFLKAVGDAFDNNKIDKPKTLKMKVKAKKNDNENKNENVDEVMKKKITKDTLKVDGEKPKRKLSEYQLFAKDQLALLKKREDDKADGEEKLKQKDLMKLVAKRWKMKKENIDEDEWDERMLEDDE